MDVPKRIVDDPSADSVARALIEDARVETAGPGGKARTLAALGLAGGAGLASTSTAFAGLKVLGAGVLVVGGVVGLGAWMMTREDPPAPVHAGSSVIAQPPVAPSMSVVTPVAETARTPDVAPRSDAPRIVPKSAPRAPAAPAASASSAAPSRLAEEARSLEVARRALEGHQARSALAALDRYERDFPRGELRPEATALRVEALAASGDESSAQALGRQFLSRYPGHPAVPRVRRAMGATNF
ncbi:MAG: hypothetical protein BGO98_33710 [Myxococcales bacterium 68-20]|nr:hypothetical protein [Myxococcales bacterium]OJY25587.1 MAG: hypothetical protein BGO98_33710 [Myxococcales bacterium 68-20]